MLLIRSVQLLRGGKEEKKKTKQTVFLVPLTSSRFALAGCLAYAGCDKGCRGGEVGIR